MKENFNFSCAFYIVTGQHTWGRHVVLSEAYKAARIKPGEKKVNYHITIFLFKEDTPAEIRTNILNCFFVDDFGGIQKCYEGITEEDQTMIKDYLIGYGHYNNKEEMPKPKKVKS